MTENEPLAYVAIALCGCLRGAAVDDPSRKRDTAKFVAEMIRHGHRIESWTCQAVRESHGRWGCEKCERPRRSRKARSQQIEAAL